MTDKQLETISKLTDISKENILSVKKDEKGCLEFSEDDFGEWEDRHNFIIESAVEDGTLYFEAYHRMGGDEALIINEDGTYKETKQKY